MKLLIRDKFHIRTYGCAYNNIDSQIMRDVLRRENLFESSLEDADFIIINTCAVKGVTENKILSYLKKIYHRFYDKKVIITGCLPQISKNSYKKVVKAIPSFSAIIDVNCINQIRSILNRIKNGEKNLLLRSKCKIDKSASFLNYSDDTKTAIIPISEGCLGSCTYCCVRRSRGNLFTYNTNNILNQIKYQLSQNKKEIFLTAQDCSSYNFKGINLIELVHDILSIDKKFYIRIGMINPQFYINTHKKFVELFQKEKLYKFLHIPIQSGSDEILQVMNRNYKIELLKESIKYLRKSVPNLTIATDIICGFPGETRTHFNETIEFIRWLKPEILNISKFSPRPNTPAKKMKQVRSELIKERTTELNKIYNEFALEKTLKWLKWRGEVLIVKKLKKNQYFGKNIYYKSIFVDGGKEGEFVNVEIDRIDGRKLIARII